MEGTETVDSAFNQDLNKLILFNVIIRSLCLLASRSFRGAMKVVFITVPTYNTAVVLCPRTNALCGISLRDSLHVFSLWS